MYKTSLLCFVLAVTIRYGGAMSKEEKSVIQSKLLGTGLDCIKDHPLSLLDIRSLKNKMLPDSKNAKCFAACLFKKIGIMDDMGKISPEGAVEGAKEIFKNGDEHLKKIEEIFTTCASVNDRMTADGEKGCDRAKLAFGCLTENAAKFGFDIDF
ncbi:hypothetical protein ACJJTC_009484 [Scirpophaga incertulas]